MNNLCTDIGHGSLNKFGEQLCGDQVNVIQKDKSTVVVLADGLGSGVKASILSTLTSKIIATMIAEGLTINECVKTMASTLPVCSVREIAYSTFTIIQIWDDCTAEIYQYDNPDVIMLRNDRYLALPSTKITVDGKTICHSKIKLHEEDTLVVFSDGAVYAGTGQTLNFGWQRSNIIEFLELYGGVVYTAKEMTALLLDECCKHYGGQPGDDTTVCIIRIRKREPMNLLIGPPANPDDCNKMMSLFFSKEGKHIVCGGTTSTIAAKYLGKTLAPELEYHDPEIPPTAHLDGVDLVTEGVITINRVLQYSRKYHEENDASIAWKGKKDGASRIAQLILEEATDINFYVGKAVNPAHQNPSLPINFNIKMRLIDELADCLLKMGKRIKVSYF